MPGEMEFAMKASFLDRVKQSLGQRYAVESQLGSGGMSIVYLAQDLKLNRTVALKILRPEYLATVGAHRFHREIRIVARLRHPNILPLHDCGDVDGIPYFVMPYVNGETLRERMNRENQMPVRDAVGITRLLATALQYAHEQNVVHRDIKPENILLDNGEAMLADFGIAQARDRAGNRDSLTITGQSIGTPHYMSPEQASGESALDGRSDIYSLACVLYEMLAGHPPFTGSNAHDVMAQHLTATVPRVAAARPGGSIPARVSRAVTRALGKMPSDRYDTAQEFGKALASADSERWSLTSRPTVVLPFAKASGDA